MTISRPSLTTEYQGAFFDINPVDHSRIPLFFDDFDYHRMVQYGGRCSCTRYAINEMKPDKTDEDAKIKFWL